MAATSAPAQARQHPPGDRDGDPGLRHRLAERGVDARLLLLVPGLVFVVGLFVYPFLYGLQLSFQPAHGGGALANYQRFFTDPYQRNTIGTTLKARAACGIVQCRGGGPDRVPAPRSFPRQAAPDHRARRADHPGYGAHRRGPAQLLRSGGLAQPRLVDLGLVERPLTLVGNYWGVFFSLVISGFPFAFLLILSYLSGIDPSLERAAATLGAHWRARFRWITLPLLAPGLATTFCLTFVLAFSVFPSAYLVGDPTGTTRVISIAAYEAAYQQYDYAFGSTIAMIMGAIELTVIGVVLIGRTRFYAGSTGGKGA